MKKKILIIGFVWVEPNSSAAGTRMMQLIKLFQQKNYKVHFATTALPTKFSVSLEGENICTQQIELNNNSFNEYIKTLNPDVVIFDRFMIEEQFSWRVTESCPNAFKILNTEDLHCLRKTRQEAFKKEEIFKTSQLKKATITKREIASIYRSDLTLIISTYEIKLLKNEFKIPDNLLYYLPFLATNLTKKQIQNLPSFKNRNHFMCIGNFLHEPNWDMVLYLKQRIWPLIRKKLPKAELHVYGAYTTDKVRKLHNTKEGFIIKGRSENVAETMQKYKVCLAPIRFGAGIKGKFIDAMQNGLPSVTTTIGAEGMHDNLSWSGYITNDPSKMTENLITLNTNEVFWRKAQQNGFHILNTIYDKEIYSNHFIDKIEGLNLNIKTHRESNFIGSLLQHHTLQSTKYLSKWIAEKNK